MQSGLHAAAGVREGDVIAGKYRIDRILGAGAMGVVVAAHHAQLDTKVAIKFLLPSMLANQEAVRRFAREARAAVKITSEHVARVFDVGILETGAPYIVMEFLDGVDLANWLQGQGPLPIEQGVDFVLQALVAVAEAHGLGIVHRDLKPSNLFCIRRADIGHWPTRVIWIPSTPARTSSCRRDRVGDARGSVDSSFPGRGRKKRMRGSSSVTPRPSTCIAPAAGMTASSPTAVRLLRAPRDNEHRHVRLVAPSSGPFTFCGDCSRLQVTRRGSLPRGHRRASWQVPGSVAKLPSPVPDHGISE